MKEYEMTMHLETADQVVAYIKSKVNEVADPCSLALGLSIGLYDMGLVRDLEVQPVSDGWSVRLKLRLTSPGCLYFVYFEDSIRLRITDPAIKVLEIAFDSGLDWTPEAMTASARSRLQAYRSRLLNVRREESPHRGSVGVQTGNLMC